MTNGQRYEFTPQQNQTINFLASTMRSVSAVVFVLGLLFFLAGTLEMVRYAFTTSASTRLLLGTVFLLLGTALGQGGTLLKKVTETHGNDVAYLMEALEKLSSTFSICLWLIVAAGVVILALTAVHFRPPVS